MQVEVNIAAKQFEQARCLQSTFQQYPLRVCTVSPKTVTRYQFFLIILGQSTAHTVSLNKRLVIGLTQLVAINRKEELER